MSTVSDEIECFLCGGNMYHEFNCRTMGDTFLCHDCGYQGGLTVKGKSTERKTKASKIGEWDGCPVTMNPGSIVMVGAWAIYPKVLKSVVTWMGGLIVPVTDEDKKEFPKKFKRPDGTFFEQKEVFVRESSVYKPLRLELERKAGEIRNATEVRHVVNR